MTFVDWRGTEYALPVDLLDIPAPFGYAVSATGVIINDGETYIHLNLRRNKLPPSMVNRPAPYGYGFTTGGSVYIKSSEYDNGR